MGKRNEIGGSPPELVMQRLQAIAFAADEETRAGDRLRALELLGKHFGMFREAEQKDVAADEPLSVLLAELRRIRRSRSGTRTKPSAKAEEKRGEAS